MRCQSFLLIPIFLAFSLITAPSRANESTTHRVASGTFGVAWIASEGLVYTYSLTQKAAPFRVNHLRAHQLAAIDYDADGRDELAIIDALNKSLFVYDFDENTMIGGFGSNVAEITAGHFHRDEPFESLIAGTYSGHVFRWNKEIGNQSWLPLPGDFVKAYRGTGVSRMRADALVTVSRGDVYTLNPIWKTYSQVLLGKDAKIAIPCDLSSYPGEEIVVACGERHDLVLCRRKTIEPLDQQATVMTCGKLPAEKNTLFAVTPAGTISQYLPKEKTWKEAPAMQAWSDLILHDMDGDGQDELFAVSARSPEELFLYDPDNESFAGIPHQLLDVSGNPSTVSLQASDTTLFENKCENVTLRNGSRVVCDCKFWNTTHKPYITRMYTPSGRNLLRDSPADHIHHHGLMFAVTANDCDFWAEFPDRPHGKEELSELSAGVDQSGRKASCVTAKLLWKDADGAEIMREERVLTAIPFDKATLLSWSSELSKAKGEEVTLTGSHYFGLGIRFVESMDHGGTFRFSEDHEESTLVRGDERVTKASWAAYTATLDGGEPATAVIFSHPDNFRPMYAFTMGDNSSAFAFLSATLNLYREPYEWESDAKLNLRWGIALLDGNVSDETIEAAYAFWKSTEKQGNR